MCSFLMILSTKPPLFCFIQYFSCCLYIFFYADDARCLWQICVYLLLLFINLFAFAWAIWKNTYLGGPIKNEKVFYSILWWIISEHANCGMPLFILYNSHFLKIKFYAWSNFDSLKGIIIGVWKTCDGINIKESSI